MTRVGRMIPMLAAGLLLAGADHVAAARGPAGVAVPISGTYRDVAGRFGEAGATGTLTGTLSLQRFAARGEQVVAIGTVAATIADARGVPVVGALQGPVELRVKEIRGGSGQGSILQQQSGVWQPGGPSITLVQQGGCAEQVLFLEIEGLTLDLLGLQVTSLNPIALVATATSEGALGALLCEVLAAVENVTRLVGLLNQLLGLLGGIAA